MVDESGIITIQMGTRNSSEMIAVQGSLCAPTALGKGYGKKDTI
jgi:hypothetical protein